VAEVPNAGGREPPAGDEARQCGLGCLRSAEDER
jgi:hypothetical protein